MIVKLLKDHTYKGVNFKKGQKIVMPKVDAVKVCQEEIAISDTDIPCEERQKKAAKKKTKKKTAEKKASDSEVDISTQL